MNHCAFWRFAPIVLAAAATVAPGCQPPEPTGADPIRPVKMMTVVEGDIDRTRLFPGTVEASRRVELAFQVAGLLAEFPVKEGQQVARDEVLARLRQDEFSARVDTLRAELDQARANLTALRAGERPEEIRRRESLKRAAEARLNNARIEMERFERLLPTRAISQQEYDRVASAYRVAQEEYNASIELLQKGTVGREEDILAMEAQIRGLEARLVEASLQLDDTTLRAPYDGVIAQRFVDEGQTIRAQQPVVTFQDQEEIDIAVDIPESVMVADIQRAEILEMNVEFSGAPGLFFPVRIREVAQVADPTTQTFRVRVAMPTPESLRVLPGMTARLSVTYRRSSVLGDQFRIPITAVIHDEASQASVWIVETDGTAARRPVRLGEAIGGQVEVTEGLRAGDRIITAGASAVREGMKVRDLGDALRGAA